MIKDSGNRTEFSTGAQRDIQHGKGRMDLLPWYGIMEVSKHCEEGAEKYGEHNVDKGIPLHSLCDSAARHLAKFIAGETDEDHLRAAAWNLLWTSERLIPSLMIYILIRRKSKIPKVPWTKPVEKRFIRSQGMRFSSAVKRLRMSMWFLNLKCFGVGGTIFSLLSPKTRAIL